MPLRANSRGATTPILLGNSVSLMLEEFRRGSGQIQSYDLSAVVAWSRASQLHLRQISAGDSEIRNHAKQRQPPQRLPNSRSNDSRIRARNQSYLLGMKCTFPRKEVRIKRGMLLYRVKGLWAPDVPPPGFGRAVG